MAPPSFPQDNSDDQLYEYDSDNEGCPFQQNQEPHAPPKVRDPPPKKIAQKEREPKANPDKIPVVPRPPWKKKGKKEYSEDASRGVDLPYPDDISEIQRKDESELSESDRANMPPADSLPYNRMKYYKPDFPGQIAAPEGAPNILLVMTDDVGFGASSTFGGPAHTPTMTKLGQEGLVYTGFHTTAICSATRAALLTGRQPHNVSTGYVVDSAAGFPGYYSQFPKSCATIGQLLRMNGYNTAWFGKNHNTPAWQLSVAGPFDQWPTGLGFERFYGFMGGEADQYHPLLHDDTVPIQPSLGKKDYHLDTDLADKCIEFIKGRNAMAPDKPFFAYYAPGATHAPHHVPQEWADKYLNENLPEEERLDIGWDELRARTLENQKKLGLVPQDTKLSPRPPEIPSWEEYTNGDQKDKDLFTRMLQVYCGFLEMCDHNIGRILKCIDETGERDNTLVFYIQGDNGGSAEGTLDGSTNELAAMLNNVPEPAEFLHESKDELGRSLHFNHMPVGFAWALNSPMQWAKRFASHFGGTRNGMVIRWPKMIKKSTEPFTNIRDQFLHIVDIVPTCLEAAGVPTPINTVNGTVQKPFDGKSLIYTFDPKNNGKNKHKEMAFEMGGTFGYYNRGWMLSSRPKTFPWIPAVKEEGENIKYYDDIEWELYNLKYDFSQAFNLLHANHLKTVSGDKKESIEKRRDQMEKDFIEMAKKNNIFPYAANGSERAQGGAGIPSVADGVGKFEYPGNLVRIPEPCAPACKNASFSIIAYADNPDSLTTDLEGVIFSYGGRYCGMGLFVWQGQLIFIYKLAHWPSAVHYIEGPQLGKGKKKIVIDFDYKDTGKLGGAGTFTLSVNNFFSKSIDLDSTVSRFFSVTECLDIGMATGTALDDRYTNKMPFKFNGKLEKVEFLVEDTLGEDAKAILRNSDFEMEEL